jgi:hypothetical protein
VWAVGDREVTIVFPSAGTARNLSFAADACDGGGTTTGNAEQAQHLRDRPLEQDPT